MSINGYSRNPRSSLRAYGASADTRPMASDQPGLVPNFLENGRQFHGWRKGLYMYPCDEAEKDRMDLFHALFLEARQQKLHEAPVPESGEDIRILDVGTGTGIWAIDMADKYRHAEVFGIDLVNIQPRSIPGNLRFRVPKDYESMWSLGEDSFDLIHIRLASGGVSSWPEMYQKVYQHLKPRTGWIEQVEIDYETRCDDGQVPDRMRSWSEWLHDATERGSKPIQYSHQTIRWLQAQGFVDVTETVIRLPFNTWPTNPKEKDLGRWYNMGLSEGLEGLSLGPFTRVYRWSASDVRRLVHELQAIIADKRNHLYHNMHVITGRRPS